MFVLGEHCRAIAFASAILAFVAATQAGEVDLTYVPDNSEVVARVNVAELNESAFVRKFREELAREVPEVADALARTKDLAALKDAADLPWWWWIAWGLERVENVTVAGNATERSVVFVFELKRDADIDAVRAFFRDAGRAEEGKIEEQSVWMLNDVALFRPREKLLVAGGKDAIVDLIKREGKSKISDGLKRQMAKMDLKQTVAVAGFASVETSEATEGAKSLLAHCEAGDDIRLEAAIDFETPEQAEQFVTGLEEPLRTMRASYGKEMLEFDSRREGTALTFKFTTHKELIQPLITSLRIPGTESDQEPRKKRR